MNLTRLSNLTELNLAESVREDIVKFAEDTLAEEGLLELYRDTSEWNQKNRLDTFIVDARTSIKFLNKYQKENSENLNANELLILQECVRRCRIIVYILEDRVTELKNKITRSDLVKIFENPPPLEANFQKTKKPPKKGNDKPSTKKPRKPWKER